MAKRRDDTWARTWSAFGTLVVKASPWLLDLGEWVFGALFALNLLLLGALLSIGPGDRAVLVASAAIAGALPPGVAGFLLLRFAADTKRVDIEKIATSAFVEAGFSVEGGRPSAKRRTLVVLRYSYGLLAVTGVCTLTGMTAAFWHMAWWIGVAFALMVAGSLGLVLRAIAATGPEATWHAPAGAVEEARPPET